MEVAAKQGAHFVLVHGACHGAWCWYKLKPLLEAAGHRVTTLDMAASGINTKTIHEVRSLSDYSEPLIKMMSSLPPEEKVILVGHSLGGLNLALAMDKFPEKVSVAVYLTAIMPDNVNQPSYVLEQLVKMTPAESWMDTKFEAYGGSEEPLTSMIFGHTFLKSKLYQLCPIQDFTLATTLARPGSLFLEDLAKANNFFTNEGYGSIQRVYVVCNQDKAIPPEFQRWMIDNSQVKEVKEINGADHMAMLSAPQQLCDCLLEIANDHNGNTTL